jgi:hypothetical protein
MGKRPRKRSNPMSKTTVRAKARTRAKPTPRFTTRRAINRKARAAPRAKLPVDDPIARLSFVALRDGRTLLLPKEGEFPRCFWHVKPTGDHGADGRLGEQMALEYLAYEEANTKMPLFLQWIVADMPRKLGPIEVSFLTMVTYAARAGRRQAEEVSAYWKRCREALT